MPILFPVETAPLCTGWQLTCLVATSREPVHFIGHRQLHSFVPSTVAVSKTTEDGILQTTNKDASYNAVTTEEAAQHPTINDTSYNATLTDGDACKNTIKGASYNATIIEHAACQTINIEVGVLRRWKAPTFTLADK
uniref:Uncharacterized protein n=1 Tax=Homalodisca liturata TaxID=320908 RepID=A0A1B6JB41_9HEMI